MGNSHVRNLRWAGAADPVGKENERGALTQMRPASRSAWVTDAWPAAVSGVIGRRTVSPHRPRRAMAHLVGAGLGSMKRLLCTGSSFRWMAAASL